MVRAPLLLPLLLSILSTAHASTPAPVTEDPGADVSFKNGIRFKDEQGRFDISMRFRIQLLAQYESELIGRTARLTAQPRRARFRFGGSVVDERLRFNLQLSFTRGDQDWDLARFPHVVRDAAVMYRPAPGFELIFGQTKLPGNRQRVVSSGDLQFIDRSIVNRAFNIDRDFGLQAVVSSPSQDDPVLWSLKAALSGAGGRNAGSRLATSRALTVRAELLPLGAFTDGGDYFEGDLAREPLPKLSVAFGASEFGEPDRVGGPMRQPLTSGSGRPTFRTFIADALFKHQGFSLYLEYMNKLYESWIPTASDFDTSQTGSISAFQPPLDGIGFVAQSGLVLESDWEPVARYAVVTPRSITVSQFADQNYQYTLGLNRYLNRHRVKVQADVSYNRFRNLLTAVNTNNWVARFQVELGI